MTEKITKNEGAIELGRTLLEKVSSSDAGKIAIFAVFAGTMYGTFKLTLEMMDNKNNTRKIDEQ